MLSDEDADVRAAAVRALAALRKEDAVTVDATATCRSRSRAWRRRPRSCWPELGQRGRGCGRGDLAAAHRRHPRHGGGRPAGKWRPRSRRSATRAFVRCWSRSCTTRISRSRARPFAACDAARAGRTSSSCRRSSRCWATGFQARRARASRQLRRGGARCLAYFMRDPDEHVWVRRHIPATLALIPTPAVDGRPARRARRPRRVPALQGRWRRSRGCGATGADLPLAREPIEALVLKEVRRTSRYLTLRYNLARTPGPSRDSLLGAALDDKLAAHARPHLPPAGR